MAKDRTLSSDERVLWQHVTQSVTPLSPQKTPQNASLAPARDHGKPSKTPSAPAAPVRPQTRTPTYTPPRPQPLDGATLRKLRRGKMPIDGRLDLHGYRQVEAHQALEGFIAASRAQGKRCVLVITGKGSFSSPYTDGKPGVLRQRVPEWLRAGACANHVVGVEESHPRHGGSGAFYVILRTSK